jgi:hypothetical protein
MVKKRRSMKGYTPYHADPNRADTYSYAKYLRKQGKSVTIRKRRVKIGSWSEPQYVIYTKKKRKR